MGILDSVLEYKKQKEAQESADLQAIPQALLAFQTGRQQAQKNYLDSLTTQMQLQKFQQESELYPLQKKNLESEIATRESNVGKENVSQGLAAAKQGLREVGPIEARRLENRALFKENATEQDRNQKPITVGGKTFILDPRLSSISEKTVFSIDDEGNLVSSGKIGSKDIVKQLPQDVETIREKALARGEASVETKQKEVAMKLGGLVRKLSVLEKQYNDAIPATGNSALKQRISGPIEVWGAKTGLKPNPKLLALKKTESLRAIQIIKMAGEAGNLAQQEQAKAIEAVSNDALTPEERFEATKSFAEFALSGADPRALEYLQKNKIVMDQFKRYGIELEGLSDNSNNNLSRIESLAKSKGVKVEWE